MATAPTLPGAPPAAAPVARADGSWFDCWPGVRSGYGAGSGDVLGWASGADRAPLRPGDYVEVAQDVDLTDQDLVTFAATATGQAIPDGLRQPGYGVAADTLLCYQMDEVAAGAREESDWRYDLRAVDGPVDVVTPTYNGGYGRARSWAVGAGALVGSADPAIIPGAGLPTYALDWWQDFDVDAIATSDGCSPLVFEHRSPSAGGLRVRWLGTAGGGAHTWTLQVEHWAAGAYSAQTLLATARAANQGDEFFTVSYDGATGQAAIYRNGALLGSTAALAHDPGQPLDGARIQVGDPAYRGTLDAVRLSDAAHDLAAHQAAYATRLDMPTTYAVRWRAQVAVDGTVYAAAGVPADAAARPIALAAPVARLTGTHAVACRLALEEAP
jgi:hypothetical protein